MNKLVSQLARRFQEIGEQHMSMLPIYNPALEVEAVSFSRWKSGSIGSMITPWFINIVYLPEYGEHWMLKPVGERVTYPTPTGEHSFMIGEDDELGKYLFISVASPTLRIRSQQAARKTALNALQKIMNPQQDELPVEVIPVPDPGKSVNLPANR